METRRDTPDARGRAPGLAWLVGPLWDQCALGWCWLPFYALVVGGLGLTGEWSPGGSDGAGREPGLGLAMTIALAVTYVHRHYTFLLVYGDRGTFGARERAYVLVPALTFVAVALALRSGRTGLAIGWSGFESGVSWWLLVLTVSGLWNVWHTVMQRHGIFRIYAGKAGAGLQEREHARRDFRMIWAVIAFVAVVVVIFRQSTFAGLFNARRLLGLLEPLSTGPIAWSVLGTVGAVAAWQAWRWLSAELSVPLPLRRRLPRLSFLASTIGLLAVFVVHGPIIGYLCFGTAHAIEYLFFLHHFGRAKFARAPAAAGPAASALRRPSFSAPILVGGLLGAYWLMRDYHDSEAWLVYYTATSLLHFLYDGWIWKVRRPEVARPLGLASATAAREG